MHRTLFPPTQIFSLTLLLSLLLALGCDNPTPPQAPKDMQTAPQEPPARVFFVENAQEAGLDFVHENGFFGEFHPAEIYGAGVALFDADGDEDLDIYLVQGGPLKDRSSLERSAADTLPSDRFYRNETRDGGLRFVEATAESGIQASGYGMGVAVGDLDNDGRSEVYVTNLGSNQLWQNLSQDSKASFVDITPSSGTDDPRWSVPATFFDYDGDGLLDLYVGNFLSYAHGHAPVCRTPDADREHCAPTRFAGVPDRLLRNRGTAEKEGKITLTTVTTEAGIQPMGFSGRALAAVAADFDGDGRQDLYVANNAAANHLWHNLGGFQGRRSAQSSFEDIAIDARCALNATRGAGVNHGVATEDFDGDGHLDLLVTGAKTERTMLYRRAEDIFEDAGESSGLGPPSRTRSGFGVGFLDIDGDALLDVFTANGATRPIEFQLRQGEKLPLRQRDHLFLQKNEKGAPPASPLFQELSGQAGDVFQTSAISRGTAFGDLDNDGDVDIVINNNGARVHLLLNRSDPPRWLGVRLMLGLRDAYGARAALLTEDGRALWRRVAVDGSYASSSDPRLVWALPEEIRVTALLVRRPDGSEEKFELPEKNLYSKIQLE